MLSSLLVLFALFGMGFPISLEAAAGQAASPPLPAVEAALRGIFAFRARALFLGDEDGVGRFYDTSSLYGRWALEHEIRRLRYLRAWTKARGIALLAVRTSIAVRTVESRPPGIWVFLVQNLQVDYRYTDEEGGAPNRFAIGNRHYLELVREGGLWRIRRDWFIDPLEEDAVVPEVEPAKMPGGSAAARDSAGGPQGKGSFGIASAPGGYDRRTAVAYADRYAGLALGTEARYNPAYRDYTNAGGDCTNFVSQVLADREGGKLKQDYVWTYFKTPVGQEGGSRAWTQAPAFVDYLLGRGRARLVGRGTYLDLVRPEEDRPRGALGALEEGDVIAYEEKGRLEHLAVVTAWDSRGYPLVNSHTADRYRVPWDLGWDKRTVFWLLHIVE